MKKLKLLIIFALICITAFTAISCGVGDNENTDNPSIPDNGIADKSEYSFSYDKMLGGYVLTGTSELFSGDKVDVPKEYSDGKNGKKNVVAVKSGAFKNLKNIKEAILPETIIKIVEGDSKNLNGQLFYDCIELEFVSISGLKEFCGELNFMNCTKLESVIVSPEAHIRGDNFGANPFTGAKVNVYINGSERDCLKFELRNNALDSNPMLTGNYYCFNESGKCNTWNYNDDGRPYVEKKHDFYNGQCKNCRAIDPKGVDYCFSSELDGYVINGVLPSLEGSSVVCLNAYYDGIHGHKPVKWIMNRAFADNKTITEVILPSSVTQVVGNGGNIFKSCTELKYVSMVGLQNFWDRNVELASNGRNNFLDCINLEKIVVNNNLFPNYQQFYVQKEFYEDYVPKIEVFVAAESLGDNFHVGNYCRVAPGENVWLGFESNGYNNNMFKWADNTYTTNLCYLYSDTYKAGCWHYDATTNRPVLW